MNALLYLLRKSAKNSFIEILHKPGRLILYILLVAAIIGFAVLSIFTQPDAGELSALFWFACILFAFITFFAGYYIAQGLSNGGEIFGINDVNLLFVSPVKPRRVLAYGFIRMAKTAFAASFFILFQTSTLQNMGVDYVGLLITLAGFIISVATLLAASLLVYSVTNGQERRKHVAVVLAVLPYLPLAAYVAAQYSKSFNIATALEAAAHSPLMQFIPISGWTAAGVTAFITGKTAEGLFFFGLNVLLFVGIMVFIMLYNPDFYEDVLVATETAYEKKRALAAGDLNAVSTPKNVRVRGTGISGYGAMALFGKHIRESMRESFFGVFPLSVLPILAGAIVMSFFTKNIFAVLPTLAWIHLFIIGTGRGLKETFTHYIYMIPESSFSKIVWGNAELMANSALAGALSFGIGGAIAGAGVAEIVVCFLTFTLFSYLIIGVNYVLMRFTGTDISAGLLITIYILSVLVAMLPGGVAAVLTALATDNGLAALLVMCGWLALAGTGCFALATGVLHNCDMGTIKTTKMR